MKKIIQKRWLRIALLLFIFSIALLIRLQYINQTIILKPIVADAKQYVAYGYNLYTHGIYSKQITDTPAPDSFRSPGYPMFIALAMLFGGDQGYYTIVIFSQVILGSLTVLLTYWLGTFFIRRQYALLAALFVALSPHLISMSSYVLTETFFCFFLLASAIVFIIALQKQRPLLFFFAALLFGYTYLVNETALFVPFIFVFVFLGSLKFNLKGFIERRLFHKIILFLFVFAIFPIIWTLRNNISLSPDAPTGSLRATSTLSHGAYPGFIYKSPQYKYFPYKEDPMQPEFGSSLNSFKRILWQRFKKDPLPYLEWYLLEKPYYLWSWNSLQGQGDIYIYPVKTSLYLSSFSANLSREIMKILEPVLLVLALTGVILILVEYLKGKDDDNLNKLPLFPFSLCIYYTLLYTITAPWPRYSVPLRPELYLFSLWCVDALGKRIMKKYDIGN
jgi:4-amino-4-deoxy-L-arabinose transferase-like glycosyltransferase